MKDRFQIAADLRRIAALLKIKGENPYKAQAYDRGARALESLEGDLSALVSGRRLRDIPGIGATLASVVEEIHETGECRLLGQLREELPPGVIELSAVPALSLKKIIALNSALQIDSIAGLKAACEKGLVANVNGFGPKTQAKLLADIEELEKPKSGEILLHEAMDEAARLAGYLQACHEVMEIDLAGALRRRRETVRRLRIVASSDQPTAVIDCFIRYPALAQIETREQSRCMGRLASGLAVCVTVVPPAGHATTLHHQTGSTRHLAKLHALMNSTEGFRSRGAGKPIKNEEEIYRRMGLQPVPPELREDEGEIEAAQTGSLPRLLRESDLRGMIHCHTVYSDGRNSIEEMALAAEAIGMSYVTITDHSPSAFYARGVKLDRLRAQWDEIARVQERVQIKILKGTESDILADGSLDYPDALLEQFDIIIASIHSRHKMNAAQMTARLRRALSLPVFKVWGHPLGRMLPSRPPFACNMEEILDVAAEARCAIEVNGDPRRLDLEPRWIRAARARGIKFIVSTDAHSTAAMKHLSFGVAMARRGWLGADEVLNTLDTGEFSRAVHP